MRMALLSCDDGEAANLVVGGLTVMERNRRLLVKAGFDVDKGENFQLKIQVYLKIKGDVQYSLGFFAAMRHQIDQTPEETLEFKVAGAAQPAAVWWAGPDRPVRTVVHSDFAHTSVAAQLQSRGGAGACTYLLDLFFADIRLRTEGWVAHTLNKTLSFALTRRLLNTRITPNQVTIANFIMGLIGCLMVSHPVWGWRTLGASLIQLNSVFDGCDGEIARLKVMSSRLGAWLDTIVDDVLNNAMLVALIYGLYRDTQAAWILPWGGAALVASLGISFYLYSFLITNNVQNAALYRLSWEKPKDSQKNGSAGKSWFDFVKPVLKRDFVIFAGMILIFLDQRQVLLIGFMIPIFAGFALYTASFVYGRLK